MSDSVHQLAPGEGKVPRAMIHKRILDAAETSPEASYEKLADEVSGASVDLVEQVIEEYGDPAEDPSGEPETEGPPPEEEQEETTGEPVPEDGRHGVDSQAFTEQLSDKQVETLEAIAANPEATQIEIAETLSVSPATVCRRVNEVDGFDWTDRMDYITNMKTNGSEQHESNGQEEQENHELAQQVAQLSKRLDQIERQLETADSPGGSRFGDPLLASKVIHACVASEQITEEEQLLITESIIDEWD